MVKTQQQNWQKQNRNCKRKATWPSLRDAALTHKHKIKKQNVTITELETDLERRATKQTGPIRHDDHGELSIGNPVVFWAISLLALLVVAVAVAVLVVLSVAADAEGNICKQVNNTWMNGRIDG